MIHEWLKEYNANDLIECVRTARDEIKAKVDADTQALLEKINSQRLAAGLPVRGVREKKGEAK